MILNIQFSEVGLLFATVRPKGDKNVSLMTAQVQEIPGAVAYRIHTNIIESNIAMKAFRKYVRR